MHERPAGSFEDLVHGLQGANLGGKRFWGVNKVPHSLRTAETMGHSARKLLSISRATKS